MSANDKFSNEYARLGDAGTDARDAATPKFISDTLSWIERVQPIVDQNPSADAFLRRTLQRYVDDQRLIAFDLTTGPLPGYMKSLFSDSVGAYAGPLHICDRLGVQW